MKTQRNIILIVALCSLTRLNVKLISALTSNTNSSSATRNNSTEKCDKDKNQCNQTVSHLTLSTSRSSTYEATTIASIISTKPPSKYPSTTQRSVGFVTRTTDAIYKVLSSVFSHDEAEEDESEAEEEEEAAKIELTTQIYNSTRRFTTPTTTTTTTTTKSPITNQTNTKHLDIPISSQLNSRHNLTTRKTEIFNMTTIKPEQLISKSSSTTLSPKPSSTTTTTTSTTTKPLATRSPGFFSTTIQPTTSQKPSSTTSVSSILTNTTLGSDNVSANISTNDQNNLTRELYSIINMAYKSLNKLRESSLLNRTIRLAPKHDEEQQDFSVVPQKLIQLPDTKLSSSEEVHLLCKFLHKHLDGTNNATGLSSALTKLLSSSTSTTTTTTTSPSSQTDPIATDQSDLINTTPGSVRTTTSKGSQFDNSKPDFVSNLRELDEKHENQLLETILSFDESLERPESSSLERIAQQLMVNLYNTAFKNLQVSSRSFSFAESDNLVVESYTNEDKELDNSDDSRQLQSTRSIKLQYNLPESPFKIKTWPKYTERFNTHLHLVYWLLEERLYRNNIDESKPFIRYKIVGAKRAYDLLDKQLSHSEIRRLLEQVKFKPIGQLVSAYNSSGTLLNGAEHKHAEEQAHSIDDSLGGFVESSQQKNTQQSSTFQTILNRFNHSSFSDDLQFYLIIFIVVLFLVILFCCLIPMLCFKRGTLNKDTPTTRRSRKRHKSGDPTNHKTRAKQAPRNQEQEQVDQYQTDRYQQQAPKVQFGSDNSVWRKLSNSTTTLVKDQTDMLKDEGSVQLGLTNNRNIQQTNGSRPHFEWYSFENRREEEERRVEGGSPSGRSYIISDKRHITKSSMETMDQVEAAKKDEQLLLEFRNKMENRSSDTLTKSELVMLKEKLIPVRLSAESEKQEIHDYVNQRALMESRASQTPGGELDERDLRSDLQMFNSNDKSDVERYIDKNSSSSSGSNQSSKLNTVIEVAGFGNKPGGSETLAERRPKMRYVELEPKTRGKVEAIRAELSKVEQRDRELQGSASQYKRYDVI